MAEFVAGPLAWTVLKLTGRLLTAGWEKLISAVAEGIVGGDEEDCGDEKATIEWGGEIIIKARERSQEDHHQAPSSPTTTAAVGNGRPKLRRGLEDCSRTDSFRCVGVMGKAADAELGGVRSKLEEVTTDVASVRESIRQFELESKEFFGIFVESLDRARKGIDEIQEYLQQTHKRPLEEAEMALTNFMGSRGDIIFLTEAHSKSMTALTDGNSLDIQLGAAVIAIAADYIKRSATDSPRAAKQFAVYATLPNIVRSLRSIWADPSRAGTPEGIKTLSFVLNIVSCVCVLPPETELVVPYLDKRLVLALGGLCAADPVVRRRYPEVGGNAVRAMLETKTLSNLCLLSREVNVDTTCCETKAEVIQSLLDSGKSLKPAPATAERALLESKTVWDLCLLAREKHVDITGCKTTGEVIHSLLNCEQPLVLGPGAIEWAEFEAKTLYSLYLLAQERHVDVTHCVTKAEVIQSLLDRQSYAAAPAAPLDPPDRASLRAVYDKTGGPWWTTRSGWGDFLPLGQWHGVTVNGEGRVTKLDLSNNNLEGTLPVELADLTALEDLRLQGNKLQGVIPEVLGGLVPLACLHLAKNRLTGSIPPKIGQLKNLQELYLFSNKLTGTIPPELGRLSTLKALSLRDNRLTGPVPPAVRKLESLQALDLDDHHYHAT